MDDIESFAFGSERIRKNIFSEDYLKGAQGFSCYNVLRDYVLSEDTEYLSRFMYIDSKVYLPDDILVKVDRMSMANSLETRIPLLDHKLIEFVAQIPERYKMKGSVSKYILKKTMENILPKDTLLKKKHGFVPPLDIWFKKDLKEMVQYVFSYTALKESMFLNVDYILKVFNDHMMGRVNNRRLLWSVLLFQLWYKKYFQVRTC
jgi:asparagine synthase (glutamine-hydrolysing)